MTAQGQGEMFDDINREIIQDHYRRPRNRRLLDAPDASAEAVNPLCGDKVRLHLKLDGDRIIDVGFRGSGCAISQSSASLLTEAIIGRTTADAARLKREMEAMLVESGPPADDLGDLAALQVVAVPHARARCALLSWSVLGEALGAAKPA